MKSIMRGILSLLIFIIGTILMLIGIIIDTIYKITRLMRYVFIRIICSVIRKMKLDSSEIDIYNKILLNTSCDDIKEASRFNNLII